MGRERRNTLTPDRVCAADAIMPSVISGTKSMQERALGLVKAGAAVVAGLEGNKREKKQFFFSRFLEKK